MNPDDVVQALARVTTFAARMAEQHRPHVEDYLDAAVPGYSLVHCPACNRPSQITKVGDPPVECAFWRDALALGLVKP